MKYSMDQIRAWAERYKILLSFSAVGREFGVSKSVINKMLRTHKDELSLRFRKEIDARLLLDGMKRCSSCNNIKPVDSFYRLSDNADGIDGKCSECHELARKAYLESEKGIASRQNWLDGNRENIKNTNKEYYVVNKDSVLSANIKWRDEHPEQAKEILNRSYNNRQERIAKLDSNSLTANEIYAIRCVFENKCIKCGSSNKICLDHHRPLSRGFSLTIDNAVLLCKKCNSSKGAKMPEDFYSKEELETINNKILKIGEMINGVR